MTQPSLPASQDLLRVAHIDLKGIQFRPSYLPQLMADLSAQHINAVLVEYEDVFPFQHLALALDKQTAWTSQTLQMFLESAASHNIEVIPLQQALGHLQYLLRWPQYRHLALDATTLETIHPELPEARDLITKMLQEVIGAHPVSRFVHVGMDEAYSLSRYAHEKGRDVLEIFLEHLEVLCEICEAHGKTPIIWSDMLEDHITPAVLQRLHQFRNRIVLCPWDYFSGSDRLAVGRIAGWRTSRFWRDHPDDESVPALSPLMGWRAPSLSPLMSWFEDMPNDIAELVEPYLEEGRFLPMFQADFWANQGFRVLGASAAGLSADRAVLPSYRERFKNIRGWSQACERVGISTPAGGGMIGHVATCWARGNTSALPNCIFDLNWPQWAELARSMGSEPPPFFEGVEPEVWRRIILSIGRCRTDWQWEAEILREMENLRPQLRTHQYEWQSLMLQLEVWQHLRQADEACHQCEIFSPRRMLSQEIGEGREKALHDAENSLRRLRDEVRRHFSERYEGLAFEEWLGRMFDSPLQQLHNCHRTVSSTENDNQVPNVRLMWS